jgi:orotidine-5'-phosphate decarboxylase
VGAQGGTADDVRKVFGAALRNVLPAVSREVLRHGPDAAALRSAVATLVDEFGFLRRPA